MNTLASVVIPAHDESASIARTLTTLRRGTSPGELEVVVVCNGCTDDTAELVRRTDPAATVVEVADAGKAGAVRVGNEVARTFPRVHLDADIEITGDSVRALVGALGDGIHAAGPRREILRRGCGRAVRAYYGIWERLPNVSTGLFGRGVVALTAEGQRRVSALPPVLSDDLAVSDAFAPDERCVVDEAVAVVRPPRTVGDLLRRRERVVTGNAQAERARLRRDSSVTRPADLVGVLRRRPTLAPQMVVFLGVTLVARVRGGLAVRRGDFTTWQRDESSRA